MRAFFGILAAGAGAAFGYLLPMNVGSSLAATVPEYPPLCLLIGMVLGVVWGASWYLNGTNPRWPLRAVVATLAACLGSILGFVPFAVVMLSAPLIPGMTSPGLEAGTVDLNYNYGQAAGYIFAVSMGLFGYVAWRFSLTRGSLKESVRTRGLFYSLVRAPYGPLATDTMPVASMQASRQGSQSLIRAFEDEVLRQGSRDVQARALLYVDGNRAVALRPEEPHGSSLSTMAGVRSHGFRVRRGVDEFWFVLHATPSSGAIKWQLDAKSRTRSFFAPLLVASLFVLPFIGLVQSGGLVGPALIAIGIFGTIQQAGVLESLFNPQRREERQRARMAEYAPMFVRSAARALEEIPQQPPCAAVPKPSPIYVEKATEPSPSGRKRRD